MKFTDIKVTEREIRNKKKRKDFIPQIFSFSVFATYFFLFLPVSFEMNRIPAEASAAKASIFFRLRNIPKINHPIFKVFAFIATITVLRLMRTAPIAGLSKIPYP